MQQLFIEIYSYKPAWFDLTDTERSDFMNQVTQAVSNVEKMGVEVLGFGYNDAITDRRCDHDFFCVYKIPSEEFCRAFEKEIAASGWYDYFDQVNLSGSVQTPSQLFSANAELKSPL